MLKRNPRRLWALIGAAGTLAIVALGYVLFISGEKSSRSDLQSEAGDVRAQAAITRTKLRGLGQDYKKLPAYKAQLATLEKAVPRGASTAQFVRDMQQIGQRAGVSITSIDITPPVATPTVPATQPGASTTGTTGAPTGATELPISVAASGTPNHLEQFLNLLQHTESRALLLGQVVESVPDKAIAGSDSKSDTLPTLTVDMKAFFTSS